MTTEELFQGFRVAAGEARFGEPTPLRDEQNDCKVSARDTGGAMCVFEFTASGGPQPHAPRAERMDLCDRRRAGVPLGEQRLRVAAGESVFVPREVPHAWASSTGKPAKVIDVYQPAGKMEVFFRELSKFNAGPPVHEVLRFDEFRRLFEDYGMKLTGPPIVGNWKVEEDGRITLLT